MHRDSVKACERFPGRNGEREEQVRTFASYTVELLAWRDWLKARGVTHLALEPTGRYWKPIYYLPEADFQMLLVNAQHVKRVPGKKGDVEDCCWLAPWPECGLVHASFVPPPPIGVLRDLTRYRQRLVQDRTREVQHLHGVLQQDAGIKLSSAAADIMGVSRRAMTEWSRRGNRWLRSALVDAAWAAVREGDGYLAVQFHRLVGHRGKKKAIVALAHSMVEIAHVLLPAKSTPGSQSRLFPEAQPPADRAPLRPSSRTPGLSSYSDLEMEAA